MHPIKYRGKCKIIHYLTIRLTNKFNPSFTQYFRRAEMSQPAQTFVFIDEHPDSINDGFFMNRLEEAPRWGNLPGSWHGGSSALSYADGHGESHKWVVGGPVLGQQVTCRRWRHIGALVPR